jgi:hypothetical protein
MPTKEEAIIELYKRGITDNLTPEQLGALDELNRRGKITKNWARKDVELPFDLRSQAIKETAQEVGPLQSFLIGTGKGFYNIGRGLGVAEKETEFEKEAFKGLEEERPYTTMAGEITGEAAPFLIPGAGAGRIASTVPRILASGGLGALEGGLIERGKGGDVFEGTTMGGSIGLGAEILFPVLGKLGRKIIQRVSGKVPKGAVLDAAGRPTKELADALSVVGMSFDDLGDDAVELITKQKPGAKAEQVSRAALFAEEGVPATKGEITKEFGQISEEQRLLQTSKEGSEALRKFKLQQSEAIKNKLESNLGFDTDIEGTGKIIQDALTGRKKLLGTQKRELYKTL